MRLDHLLSMEIMSTNMQEHIEHSYRSRDKTKRDVYKYAEESLIVVQLSEFNLIEF